MTLEGQEIHEKHQKSECCLKATAGVSRRALIQATGAIDASVLPDRSGCSSRHAFLWAIIPSR
jgi:hypothetical protein